MKTRVSKEMIVDMGLAIVREEGESGLNIRRIAEKLGCSTQPIMYSFKTAAALRETMLEKADKYMTDFLTRGIENGKDLLVSIGMNYIRFAATEKNLFRFIVMSDSSQGAGIAEIISSEDGGGILPMLEKDYSITREQSRSIFEAMFITFHGYAVYQAYSASGFDVVHCKKQLTMIYNGIINDVCKENGVNDFIKDAERIFMTY